MSDQFLPLGCVIENHKIERVLGDGSFGITYLARDLTLETQVAVKEYFPKDLAFRDRGTGVRPSSRTDGSGYARGLQRFLDEAKTLARFDDPAVVPVRRYFEANNTAYIVMQYVSDRTLAGKIRADGPLPAGEALRILLALGRGLAKVHEASILHRDIKPANILLRKDGTPVLIDFGAAKAVVEESDKPMTAMWTPGFGALEQMSPNGVQGPYTDIYGLAGVAYAMAFNRAPMDAVSRVANDSLVPLAPQATNDEERQLFALIDWGLKLNKDERPKNIDEWFREVKLPIPDGAADPLEIDIPTQATSPNSSNQHTLPGLSDASARHPGGVFNLADMRIPIVAGLLIIGAVAIFAVLWNSESGTNTSSPSPTAQVAEQNTAEKEDVETQRKEFKVTATADEWLRIDFPPEARFREEFSLVADKPFRVRDGTKVHLVGRRSTMPREFGQTSSNYIEVKGAREPVEIRLIY